MFLNRRGREVSAKNIFKVSMKTPNDETANGRLKPYLRGSILITFIINKIIIIIRSSQRRISLGCSRATVLLPSPCDTLPVFWIVLLVKKSEN